MKKTEEKNEIKRVDRSQEDKIIAGVCGGIAEYLKVDSVWIRLVAVILALASGVGIVIYIVAWIIMPKNPNHKQSGDTRAEEVVKKISTKAEKKDEGITRGRLFAGMLLILIGTGLLLRNIFNWFSFNYVWPLIIIAIGLFIMAGRRK